MSLTYIGASSNDTDRQARPYSPAVRAGDFIYVSGQVPTDANGEIVAGGIEQQARQVMENIKKVLASAGATFDDVCKCTCWIDDPRDWRGFNRVYGSYFGNVHPARSAVQAHLLVDAKVEVEMVAYKPIA